MELIIVPCVILLLGSLFLWSWYTDPNRRWKIDLEVKRIQKLDSGKVTRVYHITQETSEEICSRLRKSTEFRKNYRPDLKCLTITIL